SEDREQDFMRGEKRAPNCSSDLGASHAPAIAHGNFDAAKPAACRFDLHLDGPTEVAILHLEPAQRVGANRAKGPEICEVLTPEPLNQSGGEPIAEDRLWKKS